MQRKVIPLCALLVIVGWPARELLAAPAPPSGPHPRIWLDAETLSAMKRALSDKRSGAARSVALCKRAIEQPSEADAAVYQGENWGRYLSACALSYRLTGDERAAAVGVRMLGALLDDYITVGDGKGGDDVVRHDSGYAVRFFGPHAALGYDWLHDAPQMTEALLARAHQRFRAWLTWYRAKGYLPDTPGANYQAGYLYAKTLIAIATAGEAPEAAQDWREVVDTMLARDIVERGLRDGGLAGGDWPEGWQYGALSVLEIALVARAVEQSGAPQPELHAWADALVERFAYGTTPDGKGMFVGGDTEQPSPFIAPSSRPLLAAMVFASGPSASWAAALRQQPGVVGTAPEGRDDFPVYDALAEARGAQPAVPPSALKAPSYLSKGTRALYVQIGAAEGRPPLAAVYRSPPSLVPDHQHMAASTFELVRGDDALIVDPAPYGARSTLMSNALAIESAIPPPEYTPGQMPGGTPELTRARTTRGGVVMARSDLRGAFVFKEQSDVALAQRDWLLLPEGDLVVIDRAKTGGPSLGAQIRFRTPATLSRAKDGSAEGRAGRSQIAIRPVYLSGGSPNVHTPAVVKYVSGGPYNTDNARYDVTEYRVRVPGPAPLAIHALHAFGEREPPPTSGPLDAGHVAAAEGLLGAYVRRGSRATYVLATASADATSPSSIRYEIPGDTSSRHVVLDTPSGAPRVAVTSNVEGGRCVVQLTASGSGASLLGAPAIFTVGDATSGCRITEDPPFDASAASSLERQAPDDGAVRSPAGRLLKRLGRKKLAMAVAAVMATALTLLTLALIAWRRAGKQRRLGEQQDPEQPVLIGHRAAP